MEYIDAYKKALEINKGFYNTTNCLEFDDFWMFYDNSLGEDWCASSLVIMKADGKADIAGSKWPVMFARHNIASPFHTDPTRKKGKEIPLPTL